MEIPYEKLSDGGLQGLIEEFVARKGTEYGVAYVVLETKVRQVLQQLTDGKAIIAFDEEKESCNIQVKNAHY
jgi:uncharacterized protein YheU (UPF0270 family)